MCCWRSLSDTIPKLSPFTCGQTQGETDPRTATVLPAEIADNGYHRFNLVPIPDSHHQRDYFFIDSPES